MTENNNKFRFSLYQEDVLFCEEMFDADQFNPLTRYSIDIRDILPRAITRLQKVLSKKNYETYVSEELDLYEYYKKMINTYPQSKRQAMKYKPESITYQVLDSFGEMKTIKGVECKIGFYINEKPIVERVFYVDGFNPVSRLSLDVVEVVDDIINQIFTKIKESDIKNIWDDYDLINYGGYSINEIREFTYPMRKDILRRLKR